MGVKNKLEWRGDVEEDGAERERAFVGVSQSSYGRLALATTLPWAIYEILKTVKLAR